jgi:hypothetical protein
MGNAGLLTKFAIRPVALKNRSKMALIRGGKSQLAIQKTTTSSA